MNISGDILVPGFFYLLGLSILGLALFIFGKLIRIKSPGFTMLLCWISALLYLPITAFLNFIWQANPVINQPERIFTVTIIQTALMFYFYHEREIRFSQTISIFIIFFLIYATISGFFFNPATIIYS